MFQSVLNQQPFRIVTLDLYNVPLANTLSACREFLLLITDVLKSRILTKVFNLFSASITQQNHVIQSTCAAFILKLFSGSPLKPKLVHSSASPGNFYKPKRTVRLFRLQLDILVCGCLMCPEVLVPQIKTGDLVKTQGSSLLDRVPKFLSDGNGGAMELSRKVICSRSPTSYVWGSYADVLLA